MKQYTLKNGLRIIAEQITYIRSVSVGVWIGVGSMRESAEENGLSHFLEHMAFKGTEKRTSRQIAEEMDRIGGQTNAFTAKDCTCFYARVAQDDMEKAVDILADITLNPKLDKDEMNKERGVILEEISMVEDEPEELAHDLLAQAQYGSLPLGRPILGPESLISAYSRANLMDFRNKWYCPNNAVISIAGNYDEKEMLDLMERCFGAWEGKAPEHTRGGYESLMPSVLYKEKDIEQLNLCLGYPGFAIGDKKLVPLAVLNNLFGGSSSSRLFQKVREELGMAYSIYSYPSSNPECGMFSIYVGTAPKNAKKVVEQIDSEIDKLLKNGIGEDEFVMAKAQLRSGFILSLESPLSRMQSIGNALLLKGEVATPDSRLKDIDAVTREDVQACADIILQARRSGAVVGRNAEKLSELIRA
ncbi:MAG: pitrilysin family protein [Eubacteriales bacterium]|nr:pitrilysin family protein [Eubacteriales bacterium]MDD3883228.1 pitrilysin family protein [Eubacteriales bacterium]MDD4513838.1 pitrilysin family protein [Eubacteriales bacterium]